MEAAKGGQWMQRFGNSSSKKLVALDRTDRDGLDRSQTERSANKGGLPASVREQERSRTPQRKEPEYSSYHSRASSRVQTADQSQRTDYKLKTPSYKVREHVVEVTTPRSGLSVQRTSDRATTPTRGRLLLDESDLNRTDDLSKIPERRDARTSTTSVKTSKEPLANKLLTVNPISKPSEPSSHYHLDDYHTSVIQNNYKRDLDNLIRERERLRERSKEQKKLYEEHERSRSARVTPVHQHRDYLSYQSQLKNEIEKVHNDYRNENLKLSIAKKDEKAQSRADDSELMKKLVEYERMKIEASKSALQQEAEKVQTYRSELKKQALEDKKRLKEDLAIDKATPPGFLGRIHISRSVRK